MVITSSKSDNETVVHLWVTFVDRYQAYFAHAAFWLRADPEWENMSPTKIPVAAANWFRTKGPCPTEEIAESHIVGRFGAEALMLAHAFTEKT